MSNLITDFIKAVVNLDNVIDKYMALDEEGRQAVMKMNLIEYAPNNKMDYELKTYHPFRSERQMKLFAILVGIWMSYNEVQEDIDSYVKTALITHSISQAKEYHFKDGWQNCTNYQELKQWYLESVSNG